MDAADVRALPERIEELLTTLEQTGDQVAAEAAQDLVAAVVRLHGAGLERIVAMLDPVDVRRLADDELVASLLLLHDLHPDPVELRIQGALDLVRPYLGAHAGGIDFLGVDADGVAHLRLQGSCDSCPSSTATVAGAIERAVLDAAPEVVRLDVAGVAPPPSPGGLLQIQTRRPVFDACPVPAG